MAATLAGLAQDIYRGDTKEMQSDPLACLLDAIDMCVPGEREVVEFQLETNGDGEPLKRPPRDEVENATGRARPPDAAPAISTRHVPEYLKAKTRPTVEEIQDHVRAALSQLRIAIALARAHNIRPCLRLESDVHLMGNDAVTWIGLGHWIVIEPKPESLEKQG